MTRQHDQGNARPPDYCGRILNGNYSGKLKQRVVECFKRYHAFEETGTLGIPYIAAWREKTNTIWYEYASQRLADLLDCRLTEVAEVFRNCVIDRRIYRYQNAEAGISKEIKSREELSGAWRELREEGQKTGAIEAVYKIALRKGFAIWLKDQATIETLEADRICLSLGLLTTVSKEMEAEDELKKHRDQLEAVVQARTAELTKLNEQLKLEIVERGLAEERLQQSYNRLQQNLDETVNAMSLTVEERDPYTAGHQRRTADLAMQLASQIGLSAHAVKGIHMAGLIHDIGKISIPAEILSKPGRLNAAEIQLIRRHPQAAYDILKKIDFPWPVDLIVLQHHERIDGSGYPQGLTGGETLIEARILCVADVVEAIASHRPYRPALGIDKALAEISANSGRLYDPHVVAACLRLLREGSYQLK
ncbi:MAG: HD-GYP domain-containing protein [Deltaproteobacteria bacterium]|jgi:HD-GYP domain-containing protein (c-di-GMP phosphodiesterase class II)|nr:HD-GYP domain-containing protein [Deltaproteobacteria bacterium]